MKYRIYKITSPTGLVYIGCTRSSLKQRFSGSYNKRLTEDFEKYGKKNFKIELLKEIENDPTAARIAETEAIKQYDSTNKEKGYNLDKESDYPELIIGQRNGNSITTSIVFDNEQERDYIKRLIKVRRNLIGLVENGALTAVPDMIALAMSAIQGNKPQTVSPLGIVADGFAELPPFVEDVLNGGTYPNPEDCTEEERGVLYNPMFQEHYKRYISTKDDKSRGLLRGIIAEFIEHNFPMLKKDTK